MYLKQLVLRRVPVVHVPGFNHLAEYHPPFVASMRVSLLENDMKMIARSNHGAGH